VTSRERFLAQMGCGDRWARLLALIEPHHAKAGNGTLPVMERMQRIYFMQNRYFVQNWFNLSDSRAEDAPYESESMRRFAGIGLAEDTIPDE
jgi:transposase, IS5 family